MTKAATKILKGLNELKDVIVHPGRQAVRIAGDSVIISVEYYEHLIKSERLDSLAKLDDDELKTLAELKIKVASNLIRSELPRYIVASSAAGVIFREGFENVVAKALAAAERITYPGE
jgi:hypothetical protein